MKIVIIMLHCKLYCKDIIQNQTPFFFWWEKFQSKGKESC